LDADRASGRRYGRPGTAGPVLDEASRPGSGDADHRSRVGLPRRVLKEGRDHAAAIACWYEARLTLLYVFANLPAMELPPLVLEDADRERLMSDLRRMAAAVPRDVPVEFRIQEAGYVHEEILAQLSAMHADVLVIGTHGRSGFQRLFLGSVTEKVIRKATCPTLVVPPRAPDVPAGAPIQFRRILCAVDFSESSFDALTLAINMVQEAEAQLTLLHVVEFAPE
jgi:nucleotide-binding universal stress UspA family protein